MIISFCIFIVAILYSSIGHGGASGYLAIMVLFGIEPQLMRSSALILNIIVAGVSFYHYYKNRYFRWKYFFPFALSSVPFAFFGGMIMLDSSLYKKILGICLLIAVIRITLFTSSNEISTRKINFLVAIIIGAVIGFVSGLIGIGGGIFLTPILLLLHWANMKEAAALSALFIFVNSIAGVIGLIHNGFQFHPDIIIWVITALIGGLLGSYFGSSKLSVKTLKFILSCVLLFVSLKLLI